jgi:hypothetical protein
VLVRELSTLGLTSTAKVQGIVRELSATYVPDHNGRAERLNRTLLERTRALMHEHKAPKVLRAHAIQAACMLKNCIPGNGQTATPHQRLIKASSTPHQLLFGKRHTETKDRFRFESQNWLSVADDDASALMSVVLGLL